MNPPFFELLQVSENSKARLGKIRTAHGDVSTPVFMPVGTNATVKGLAVRDLREMQAEIILPITCICDRGRRRFVQRAVFSVLWDGMRQCLRTAEDFRFGVLSAFGKFIRKVSRFEAI